MITVVGIGADGWDGLVTASRLAIEAADVLVGSGRQLALVPEFGVERVPLPSPLMPNLPGLLNSLAGRAVCVLASGDPMFHGIGATLVRLLGAEQVRVLPQVSSVSLACARLGWPMENVEVVNLVGRPPAALRAVLQPGRRVVVLGGSAEVVTRLVVEAGYGPSRVVVLSDLGASTETTKTIEPPESTALAGTVDSGSDLHVIAIDCVAASGVRPLARVPGLPDDAFEHDGQLTKREVRAVSLAALAPIPGELLWDVGAGAGSIAVEWMRAHPSCRAVAVESKRERAARIGRNADTLGVPALKVVEGRAPAALDGLPVPDAVFVGGGATVAGLIEACWQALRPGGRLVANAVTLESEAVVAGWYGRLGGDLVRLAVQRASPVGGFTGWRAAMPVTVWSVTKETP
ncbi:precorrin-6y C5,15-methyltransferase (decarboxylating) subunit CbiE [Nonomuraea sp. NBC_01738]|uniref:precorrin-6y C5,15-methyltransferase (decarboxylating) subunit CbiE n=1 Tax=Nonomuraea sp. NBC_01738 TaxID=2976003 RepID=UPI002E10F21F|nr:precorrin-6y C5,15-methyltransferase (decarboxylating) subunit CbiE [Nonomuraea sp. NBC_01738]